LSYLLFFSSTFFGPLINRPGAIIGAFYSSACSLAEQR